MQPGIRKILNSINRDPRSTILITRLLSLLKDEENLIVRTKITLDLCQIIRVHLPQKVIEIAYEAYHELKSHEELEATKYATSCLRLIIAAKYQLNKLGPVAKLEKEVKILEDRLASYTTKEPVEISTPDAKPFFLALEDTEPSKAPKGPFSIDTTKTSGLSSSAEIWPPAPVVRRGISLPPIPKKEPKNAIETDDGETTNASSKEDKFSIITTKKSVAHFLQDMKPSKGADHKEKTFASFKEDETSIETPFDSESSFSHDMKPSKSADHKEKTIVSFKEDETSIETPFDSESSFSHVDMKPPKGADHEEKTIVSFKEDETSIETPFDSESSFSHDMKPPKGADHKEKTTVSFKEDETSIETPFDSESSFSHDMKPPKGADHEEKTIVSFKEDETSIETPFDSESSFSHVDMKRPKGADHEEKTIVSFKEGETSIVTPFDSESSFSHDMKPLKGADNKEKTFASFKEDETSIETPFDSEGSFSSAMKPPEGVNDKKIMLTPSKRDELSIITTKDLKFPFTRKREPPRAIDHEQRVLTSMPGKPQKGALKAAANDKVGQKSDLKVTLDRMTQDLQKIKELFHMSQRLPVDKASSLAKASWAQIFQYLNFNYLKEKHKWHNKVKFVRHTLETADIFLEKKTLEDLCYSLNDPALFKKEQVRDRWLVAIFENAGLSQVKKFLKNGKIPDLSETFFIQYIDLLVIHGFSRRALFVIFKETSPSMELTLAKKLWPRLQKIWDYLGLTQGFWRHEDGIDGFVGLVKVRRLPLIP